MKNKILLAIALLSSSSMVMAGGVEPVSVPEPSMLPLLAIGVVALIISKLRKK